MLIYDQNGAKIGDVLLSQKQQALVDSGQTLTVLYHTPQLMRGLLGTRNGSFTLRKDGERIVTKQPVAVQEYIDLQKAIAVVRENEKAILATRES
jgi:hypothetical protein